MKIPTHARYRHVTGKASEFLIENNVDSFPVDPFAIAEYMDIPIYSYTEAAESGEFAIETLNSMLSSDDGVCLYQDQRYYVIYNDSAESIGRIRFTLLHELGHIYLGHFEDFDKTALYRSACSVSEYKILENEANCFARNTIAPIPIVLSLREQTVESIINIFHTSEDAAKTRLSFLETDKYYSPPKTIVSTVARFRDFLHRLSNTYECPRCENISILENPKFCTICRHDTITRIKYPIGVDYNMIYRGVSLSDNYKARICPRCQNEETAMQGEHCIQCGAFLFNYCTNIEYIYNNQEQRSCPDPLPGNARHCPYCGTASTFLEQNFLQPWQEAKKEVYENPFEDPFETNKLPWAR